MEQHDTIGVGHSIADKHGLFFFLPLLFLRLSSFNTYKIRDFITHPGPSPQEIKRL